jgi:hypothetical protein
MLGSAAVAPEQEEHPVMFDARSVEDVSIQTTLNKMAKDVCTVTDGFLEELDSPGVSFPLGGARPIFVSISTANRYSSRLWLTSVADFLIHSSTKCIVGIPF